MRSNKETPFKPSCGCMIIAVLIGAVLITETAPVLIGIIMIMIPLGALLFIF